MEENELTTIAIKFSTKKKLDKKKVHPLFRSLVDEHHSPLYGKDIKDVFIFAMALGFMLKKRKKLGPKRDIADVDVFDDDQKLLIKTIAMKVEKNLEILIDEKKIFSIAEEFANGGIHILYELVFKSKEGPLKALDKKITKLIKK